MLSFCKSEPQYAYKCYAYKRNMYLLHVLLHKQNIIEGTQMNFQSLSHVGHGAQFYANV